MSSGSENTFLSVRSWEEGAQGSGFSSLEQVGFWDESRTPTVKSRSWTGPSRVLRSGGE